MRTNTGRVWLGGIAGGIVWNVLSFLIYMRQAPLYEFLQRQNLFLAQPRYPFFKEQWIGIIFVMSMISAYLYAWVRAAAGAGPKTALRIGILVGFLAGFPSNFAQASWSPIPRIMPLGWMIELWMGAILASLTAGFLYKE